MTRALTGFGRFFGVFMIGVFGAAESSPGATLTLTRVSPAGTGPIEQGTDITFEVFVDTGFDALRGYQAALQVTGGTAGTLTLADMTLPPNPNSALFITTTRPDFVFFGLGPFTSINVTNLAIVGTLATGTSTIATPPKYCGTYKFRASTSALGTFNVNFREVNGMGQTSTFILAPGVGNPRLTITSAVGAMVTVIPPIIEPPNDDCADAAVLIDGVNNFTTQDATTEPSIPALPASCDEGAGLSFDRDVWYDYTATCTGILTVSTCGTAAFNTRLAVYDAPSSACACPTDNSGLVTCDDNTSGCSSNTSEVVISAVTGNCYKVRLGGVSGAQGTGTINVSCTPNDECANARTVAANSTTSGSTRNTNIDNGLPTCGPAVVSPGVWFRVVGNGNRLTASTCTGTLFNTRLSVFTGTGCNSLTCVAGADNTCGSQEVVSWCSTLNEQYWILVHGGTGATGFFTLTMVSTSCNDNNLCTQDSCNVTTGACVNTVTTPSGMCCAPTTGVLTPIDDMNPCTNDVCNANGSVSHPPGPNGANMACEDDFRCTRDECLNGACANIDINGQACSNDAQCPGGHCVTNACICIEDPTLDLIPEAGTLPVSSCYSLGDVIRIRVEMGFAPEPIVGGQVFLEYDPSTLLFLDMQPGNMINPTSPFTFELGQFVNPIQGKIDYAAAVPPGGLGTANPTTYAVITFQAIGECDPFVRFRANTPQTLLLDSAANVYTPVVSNLPAIRVNGSPPAVSGCPAGLLGGFDAGEFTSSVTWTEPVSFDSCDGNLTVTCDPPSGSAFIDGTTSVTCTSVNSCGVEDSCSFDVDVTPSVLSADVQMSPVLAAPSRTRCLTFELIDCDGGMQRTVQRDVTLVAGTAISVPITIPGGDWDIIIARDSLHSLRSQALDLSTTDSVNYSASFMNDPLVGGTWLVGGNLNDDNFIDIQDYVRFLQQYLALVNPHTPCGTLPYHADINASGTVDVADLSFIQVSLFTQAVIPACGGPASSDEEGPTTSVTLRDLRRKGLGHLAAGDLNNDGVLDATDVAEFLANPPILSPVEKGREPIRAVHDLSPLGLREARGR